MLDCRSPAPETAIDTQAREAATYRAAACGNHDAQIDMAWLVLRRAMDGKIAFSDGILLALMWSNMAATSGEAAHALAHAAVLLVQAGQAIEAGYSEKDCEDVFAQALAIADSAADAGHSRAELIGLDLASRMAVSTIARAQVLQANINIKPLTAEERSKDDEGLGWVVAKLGEIEEGGHKPWRAH
jgi:hypothetical protein